MGGVVLNLVLVSTNRQIKTKENKERAQEIFSPNNLRLAHRARAEKKSWQVSFSVLSALCSALCTLCSVQCIVLSALCSVLCAVLFAISALCNCWLQCVMFEQRCTLLLLCGCQQVMLGNHRLLVMSPLIEAAAGIVSLLTSPSHPPTPTPPTPQP